MIYETHRLDINEGSYVILYKALGGDIILPGDAHDASWQYISRTDPGSIKEVAFLLAPHHGRDSQRSYDFLEEHGRAVPVHELQEALAAYLDIRNAILTACQWTSRRLGRDRRPGDHQGGQSRRASQLARHLQRTDTNERVQILQLDSPTENLAEALGARRLRSHKGWEAA